MKTVALVGLGYWGKNILRNLHELGVLHSACDISQSVVNERRKEYPSVQCTATVEDILQNTEIKAVAIATPAATHYDLAKRALLAGKDVFVEKPLALTVKEGNELVDMAARQKRVLMVGHVLQFHPAVQTLKNMIRAGELGKIQYVHSNRLNIGKLRTEENILWSFAPHDISVILSLIGEEPVHVSAWGGAYLNVGVSDTTVTTLEFRNSVRGHIFVSWLHPFKEQKLVVIGSGGMAVFDDMSPEKLFVYPHRIEWQDGKTPVAQKAEHWTPTLEHAEPLKAELQHFVKCVQTREVPLTDGNEGLRVLRVLEAADKCMAGEGRKSPAEPARAYFVHESSYVDADVQIAEGTKIWHFSHIQGGTRIGKNCVLGQNVNVGNNVSIGNFVKIQNNVSVYEGVILEDYVFCGPSMVFTNVDLPRSKYPQRGSEFYRKTLVREGASLGANCTVVCGHTIGRHAFIGAGAVVTKDIPDFALVVGNPARIAGWMSEAGKKLEFDEKGYAFCEKSGKKYKLVQNTVKEI